MNDIDYGVEIEYLPTIGGALSFKNARNRSLSMSQSTRDFETRKLRGLMSHDLLRVTCNNIIKHPKTWKTQKHLAIYVLKLLDEDKYPTMKQNFNIQKIANGLNKYRSQHE